MAAGRLSPCREGLTEAYAPAGSWSSPARTSSLSQLGSAPLFLSLSVPDALHTERWKPCLSSPSAPILLPSASLPSYHRSLFCEPLGRPPLVVLVNSGWLPSQPCLPCDHTFQNTVLLIPSCVLVSPVTSASTSGSFRSVMFNLHVASAWIYFLPLLISGPIACGHLFGGLAGGVCRWPCSWAHNRHRPSCLCLCWPVCVGRALLQAWPPAWDSQALLVELGLPVCCFPDAAASSCQASLCL